MSSYIRTGWETGFFQSPNCIFDVKDLKMRDKLCYLYLCRCADGEMKSFPSYNTIGEKMGASRVTAIEAVKSLEEKGYLRVERRRVSRDKNLTNIYTLVHPEQVIHSGKDYLPEQEIGGKDSELPSKNSVPPSIESVPNKYSLKNTHLKKDIHINNEDAPKEEFHFYNWLDNQ